MEQTSQIEEKGRKYFRISKNIDYTITLSVNYGIGGVNDNRGGSCATLEIVRGSSNRNGQKVQSHTLLGNGMDYSKPLEKLRLIFNSITEKNVDKYLKKLEI